MTGKEIIIRAIEFRDPERIGLTFTHGSGRINDMVKAEISGKAPDWKASNEREMWRDEWGNIWSRANDSSKGEVNIPALKKWDDLKSYKPPDIDNPARYKEAREKFKPHLKQV